MSLSSRFVTHEVENRPVPLRDYNMWDSDPVLRAAVMYRGSQADAGVGCPMSMTYGRRLLPVDLPIARAAKAEAA